jgi:hypothetical protein
MMVCIMELQITSKYPKNVVKDLIHLAYDKVFGGQLKKPDFRVKVKNSRHAYAGAWYGYLIVIRIGAANKFPRTAKYPRLVTAPEYTFNDWVEAMFGVAVHEFWHGLQGRTRSELSEIECEKMTLKYLEEFRLERPQLEAKWAAAQQRVEVRKTAVMTRQAQKNTPQYELTTLGQKMATFQRRIKLYTTKMKKLQRRKRHLEKKIAESACLQSTNP